MKVTVLIENSAPEGLIREHGLSFLIEYRGGRYLLDAGESGVFLLNARDLGADLASVDAAFLSHGHYDHGDGFSAFRDRWIPLEERYLRRFSPDRRADLVLTEQGFGFEG